MDPHSLQATGSEDRGVHQGFAPEGGCEAGVPVHQVTDGVVRRQTYGDRSRGAEGVVHDVEVEALQVRHVARHVQGGDLPFPVLGHDVAEQEPVDENAAMRGSITLSD